MNSLWEVSLFDVFPKDDLSRMNNIWNHAGAIIFVCDVNGIVQFFNPAAEKAFGYTSSQVLNKISLLKFHLASELEKKAKELSELSSRKVAADFDVFSTAVSLNVSNNQ